MALSGSMAVSVIRTFRLAAKLSQAEFARRLCVSTETYRAWDSDRRQPPSEALDKARALAAGEDEQRLGLPALARILGVSVYRLRRAARDGRLPAWLLLCLIAPQFFISNPGGLVIVWWLVGCGLHEAATYATSKRWPRVTGPTLIVLLLIVILTAPLPAAGRSAPPAPQPMGHDRLTLSRMRALVSNIPSGSDIVRDDVVTGIFLRAMRRDFERARVDIAPIDLDPAAIRPELNMQRRVFALPHAQQSLSLQGFKIVDSLHVADRGLAEVAKGGDCVTASQQWQTAISLAGLRDIAFVSDRESRQGPVVIYLVGDEPIHINAVNWPPRTLRGFSPRTFDLSNDRERADFERQRTEDGGPWTVDLSERRSVTRVALWRMPDSALAMPINLSAPAVYAAVKLAPEAERSVSVCPSFPATVSAIR